MDWEITLFSNWEVLFFAPDALQRREPFLRVTEGESYKTWHYRTDKLIQGARVF